MNRNANNARKNATKQKDTLRDYFVFPLDKQKAPWQYSFTSEIWL